MDEIFVEISLEQNVCLNHFDSFGSVQLKTVDATIAHTDSSPHFWQEKINIDAHLTETFIDSLEIKTHKLIENPNIKIFLKLPSKQKT